MERAIIDVLVYLIFWIFVWAMLNKLTDRHIKKLDAEAELMIKRIEKKCEELTKR